MEESFANDFDARPTALSADEVDAARALVESKYATPAWINRLP
jgi:hypothetical protein